MKWNCKIEILHLFVDFFFSTHFPFNVCPFDSDVLKNTLENEKNNMKIDILYNNNDSIQNVIVARWKR